MICTELKLGENSKKKWIEIKYFVFVCACIEYSKSHWVFCWGNFFLNERKWKHYAIIRETYMKACKHTCVCGKQL